MYELLKEDYPAWQDSFLALPEHGIRINELKTDADHFKKIWTEKAEDTLPDSTLSDPIGWIHNGFHINDTSRFSGHPLYQAGLYYIQEPSAMTPAEILPISRGDFVLDLCAAPGGKATELLSKLGGSGLLYANDISVSRAQALRKNIEMSGAVNAYITAEAPEKLSSVFPSFFDKILVDAPCSGEGMFRRKPEMIKDWLEKGPEYYALFQFEILEAAVKMLRNGGLMVYSTCTFSEIENEGNIIKLLKMHPELEICSFNHYPGFLRRRLPELSDCVRVMPHRMRGEGQFICLLHKKNLSQEDVIDRQCDIGPIFYQVGDRMYRLPEGHMPRAGIRYLMTGLHVGTLKFGVIHPSQAFAQALSKGEWPGTFDLKADDERLFRYLRGESIPFETDEITFSGDEKEELFGLRLTDKKIKNPDRYDSKTKPDRNRKGRKVTERNIRSAGFAGQNGALYAGDILVLAEGFPIGFGQASRGLLKNRRNPGWRTS